MFLYTIIQRKYILYFAFLFFIILSFACSSVPFFWDGAFFSELACYFYENGVNGFIAPINTDTGGFPLYSLYLAFCWTIASKTLFISHLAMLPFLLGISYEYFKFARRFLNDTSLFFAMLLLIVDPTYVTQSIIMGYDIIMIYFFMLSINALLDKKNILYSIGITLLCLSSVRGMMLGLSLAILDFVMHFSATSKLKLNVKNYIFPFIVVTAWIIYHYQKTAWYFFSPVRDHAGEAFLPMWMMFRQFIFIGLKLIDFGRIVLWGIFFLMLFYTRKRIKNTEFKFLLQIIFIPLGVLYLFMTPIENPAAHRYFIIIFLCLNIAICYLVQQLKQTQVKFFLLVVCLISLISGNFWIYPQRYGNGWDASLKVLPFFTIEKKMADFIKEKKISPNEIGTQFPLVSDREYSHLSDTSYRYTNVWRGPLSKYHYFLQSNVINTDIPEQFEFAENNWVLLKRFQSGQVYISLYKNKWK